MLVDFEWNVSINPKNEEVRTSKLWRYFGTDRCQLLQFRNLSQSQNLAIHKEQQIINLPDWDDQLPYTRVQDLNWQELTSSSETCKLELMRGESVRLCGQSDQMRASSLLDVWKAPACKDFLYCECTRVYPSSSILLLTGLMNESHLTHCPEIAFIIPYPIHTNSMCPNMNAQFTDKVQSGRVQDLFSPLIRPTV
jgi:hypothetical protein